MMLTITESTEMHPIETIAYRTPSNASYTMITMLVCHDPLTAAWIQSQIARDDERTIEAALESLEVAA